MSIGFTFDHGAVNIVEAASADMPSAPPSWFEHPLGQVDEAQLAVDLHSGLRVLNSRFPTGVAAGCMIRSGREEAVFVPFTTHQIGPCFAAEVAGLDLREPLSPQDVAAIHAAMDAHAVLVFHDQYLTDEQHLAFSRSLGELEEASGTSLREADDFRLPTTFADVSNLDKDQQVLAVDDRRRLFAIGNRLWHSDSSFKVVPAKYSLLRAVRIPSKGGNTEYADMRSRLRCAGR